VSECTPGSANAASYGPAVSPHFAAELSGLPVDPVALREAVVDAGARHEAVIVEGVGGLLVPLSDGWSVRDLAGALALPIVIAARSSLGTINHTLLTLEAARARRLGVVAVVLTPWPDRPEPIHHSNRETIARLGAVDVATLPTVARPEPGLLAAAGAGLPIDRWLG
jgi:dethiobiotin synthetase